MATFMAITPIFGNRSIPQPVKILLSLVMTLVIFPVIKQNNAVGPRTIESQLLILALREVFIGVFLGFLTRLIFAAVEVSGQILSLSMGFTTASLINPAFNESDSVMAQFELILATLLFLAVNGHHLFIEAIYKSYQLAPVGVFSF